MNADYQQVLFPYAYNILGSADDALDAIQDVLLKFVTLPKGGINDERNYLIRSVINRAINMKSRKKRFAQDDVWLPEPVATEGADKEIHLKDILSYSLMVLLERLSAQERAVFILRESFDYSHQDIAEALGVTEEHSRKLLSRAKSKLFKTGATANRPSGINNATTVLLEKYIEAIRSKEMGNVEELLAEDIVFYADGGATLNVARKRCVGAADVADLLLFVYDNYQTAYQIKFGEVNHQPALLYYFQGQLKSCQVFDISHDGGHIVQINSIVDPAKIKRISTY